MLKKKKQSAEKCVIIDNILIDYYSDMAGIISSLRGGNSVIRPIRECAAGQGMVFYLSDLNRLYSFAQVCPKQGM